MDRGRTAGLGDGGFALTGESAGQRATITAPLGTVIAPDMTKVRVPVQGDESVFPGVSGTVITRRNPVFCNRLMGWP